MATVVWSDVDPEYTKQEDGDIQRDTEVNAIFNSVKNIILTIQGERRMLPTFATNVYGLLFEKAQCTNREYTQDCNKNITHSICY